jgi:hypothetical protein
MICTLAEYGTKKRMMSGYIAILSTVARATVIVIVIVIVIIPHHEGVLFPSGYPLRQQWRQSHL